MESQQKWQTIASERLACVCVCVNILLIIFTSSHSAALFPPRPEKNSHLNTAMHELSSKTVCIKMMSVVNPYEMKGDKRKINCK